MIFAKLQNSLKLRYGNTNYNFFKNLYKKGRNHFADRDFTDKDFTDRDFTDNDFTDSNITERLLHRQIKTF